MHLTIWFDFMWQYRSYCSFFTKRNVIESVTMRHCLICRKNQISNTKQISMEILSWVLLVKSWIFVNWCLPIHYSLCETMIKANQINKIYWRFSILLFIFNPDRDKIMTRFFLVYISYKLLFKFRFWFFIRIWVLPNNFMYDLILPDLKGWNADLSFVNQLTIKGTLIKIVL